MTVLADFDVLGTVRPYLPNPVDFHEDSELDELGLDGLDRISIALDLEEEFDIEISDAEHDRWQLVSDISRTVCDHLGLPA